MLMAKSALGRGFSALLGETKPKDAANKNKTTNKEPSKSSSLESAKNLPPTGEGNKDYVIKVPIETLFSSRLQPRKVFPKESLEELSQSIQKQGVLQPLVVRQINGGYELIAGERRLRASKLAGLKEVPVVIRQADDRTVLELMLVENLQREGLNPMDEARGFEQLIREFNLTQEVVAERVGKSRAVVANALRLLKLPQSVQQMVADARLSVGHAKAILALELFEDMQVMAERIINGKLSVRETEALIARKLNKDGNKKEKTILPQNIHLKKIEDILREKFGTQVRVKSSPHTEKGCLEIQFFSKTDLNRLLELLSIKID